jgi:hypothetical protein
MLTHKRLTQAVTCCVAAMCLAKVLHSCSDSTFSVGPPSIAGDDHRPLLTAAILNLYSMTSHPTLLLCSAVIVVTGPVQP